MQAKNQVKVTLVGAVYETAVTNGREFKKDAERRLEEKRAEEAQRLRELTKPKTPPKDIVNLTDAKAAALVQQAAAIAPEPSTPVATPARGGTYNLNA